MKRIAIIVMLCLIPAVGLSQKARRVWADTLRADSAMTVRGSNVVKASDSTGFLFTRTQFNTEILAYVARADTDSWLPTWADINTMDFLLWADSTTFLGYVKALIGQKLAIADSSVYLTPSDAAAAYLKLIDSTDMAHRADSVWALAYVKYLIASAVGDTAGRMMRSDTSWLPTWPDIISYTWQKLAFADYVGTVGDHEFYRSGDTLYMGSKVLAFREWVQTYFQPAGTYTTPGDTTISRTYSDTKYVPFTGAASDLRLNNQSVTGVDTFSAATMGTAGTSTLPFWLTHTGYNTNRSTEAQIKDTSFAGFPMTNSGKPEWLMRDVAGNIIAYLDSAGRMGFGGAPTTRLYVSGTALVSSNLYCGLVNHDGGMTVQNGSSGDLNFNVANAGNWRVLTTSIERARITSDGFFGLNTTTPYHLLSGKTADTSAFNFTTSLFNKNVSSMLQERDTSAITGFINSLGTPYIFTTNAVGHKDTLANLGDIRDYAPAAGTYLTPEDMVNLNTLAEAALPRSELPDSMQANSIGVGGSTAGGIVLGASEDSIYISTTTLASLISRIEALEAGSADWLDSVAVVGDSAWIEIDNEWYGPIPKNSPAIAFSDSAGYRTSTSTAYKAWAHTVAGDYLLVSILCQAGYDQDSVEWGTTNMAQIYRVGGNPGMALWGLANPTPGADSVRVYLQGACYAACFSASYLNVDEAAPLRDTVYATAADSLPTVTVTGLATTDLAIAIVGNNDGLAYTATAEGMTILTNINIADGEKLAFCTMPGAVGDIVFAGTLPSPASDWRMIGVVLKQK